MEKRAEQSKEGMEKTIDEELAHNEQVTSDQQQIHPSAKVIVQTPQCKSIHRWQVSMAKSE